MNNNKRVQWTIAAIVILTAVWLWASWQTNTTTIQQAQGTPTPQLVPATTPDSQTVVEAEQAAILAEWDSWFLQVESSIQAQRTAHGLPPLIIDYRLRNAADFHNRWMRDTGQFCHDCPGEPNVCDRITQAGFQHQGCGEIIGKGQTSVQEMMTGQYGWMNSPGHRNAILNPGWWNYLGCGYLRGPSGQNWDSYWSCEFAKGDTASQPQPTQPPVPSFPTPTRTVPPFQPPPPPTPTVPRAPTVAPLPTMPPQAGVPTCPRGYVCFFVRSGVALNYRAASGVNTLRWSYDPNVQYVEGR